MTTSVFGSPPLLCTNLSSHSRSTRGMEGKWVRWILSILLLAPLWFVASALFRFNPLRDIGGFIFVLYGVVLGVVVPIAALWLKQCWFFYYMYGLVPLEFVSIVLGTWVISLFGDQYYSPLAIALQLYPLLIYFGAEIVLTVVLHRLYGRQKIDQQVQ